MSPQQFVKYSLDFPSPVLVATEVADPVSCDSLYLPISPFNVWSNILLCDLISLLDLRRVVDFSVCSVCSFVSVYILLVRMEGQFPSILQARLKARSLFFTFSSLDYGETQ